jgi:hypothetical protein
VLPKLIAYDDWLVRRRCDSQGRFILWHGDESGWDDATRHYPVPVLPFDVQLHQQWHRLALLQLSGSGLPKALRSREQLLAAIERSKRFDSVLQSYWHADDKWHYDLEHVELGSTATHTDEQRTISGTPYRNQIAASGLFALLWGDDDEVVEYCVRALNDPRVFGTKYPIPTLAACDPDYRPHGWGWNGPAWLQVNYFVVTGLLTRGRTQMALELWEKTRRLVIRDGMPHSYELYDPETGTGMGCPDYSWQAMVNHLIIRYFAGVDAHFITPCLPGGINRLRVRNLSGDIASAGITRIAEGYRLEIEFKRKHWPFLDLRHLGDVREVRGNGIEFESAIKDKWMPRFDAEISDVIDISAEEQAALKQAMENVASATWQIEIATA